MKTEWCSLRVGETHAGDPQPPSLGPWGTTFVAFCATTQSLWLSSNAGKRGTGGEGASKSSIQCEPPTPLLCASLQKPDREHMGTEGTASLPLSCSPFLRVPLQVYKLLSGKGQEVVQVRVRDTHSHCGLSQPTREWLQRVGP